MISCLYHLVSNAASRWPDKTAIIEAGNLPQKISYKRLDEKTGILASHIVANGLKKLERVGILSRNSIGFAAAYFAVLRAGGVAVPLNHTLEPSELSGQARDCALAAIYSQGQFRDKAVDIASRARSVRFVFGDEVTRSGFVNCKTTKPDDPASIIYTSGTTRIPLGVILTNRNLISNSASIVRYAAISNKDSICCVLPFYYIYGLSLLLTHFLAGGTVIIENRFLYPDTVLDTIDSFGATGFAGVSSHYAILLDRSGLAKRRLPILRYFMQAGDRMPPSITKRLISLFPRKKIYLMYGQTEASPRLTYLEPALARNKPDSVGKAIPGVKIKVVDKNGRECGTGKKGEIIAKGSNITSGYWKNRCETAKVLKGGWLYTGDLAYKDADDDLFIVGRKKNFIKTGGQKVDLGEIERAALSDNRVAEAAAVDVPDPVLGSRVNLYVAPAPRKKLKSDQVMRLYRQRLARYKIPSKVVVLKELPKNSYGKIDKESLR
jgi:long-chain acyl-CoA synthetase